jgi:DNA-binding response OmpR family regulator
MDNMPNKQILLYDTNRKRGKEVAKSLETRGYIGTTVNTDMDCIRKIDSENYSTLLIDCSEDDSYWFNVIAHAGEKGIDVFPISLYGLNDRTEQTDRVIHRIERAR